MPCFTESVYRLVIVKGLCHVSQCLCTVLSRLRGFAIFHSVCVPPCQCSCKFRMTSTWANKRTEELCRISLCLCATMSELKGCAIFHSVCVLPCQCKGAVLYFLVFVHHLVNVRGLCHILQCLCTTLSILRGCAMFHRVCVLSCQS